MQTPVTDVVPISSMIGDDENETELLHQMYNQAVAYLTAFSWCGSVLQSYFGAGIGQVIAVFLFQIQPATQDVDEWLWVIVGDIPPAYLVLDESRTPLDALKNYIGCMREWVALALEGKSSRNVIPVNAPAMPEFARTLETRLNALEQEILPILSRPGRPKITASDDVSHLQ